MSNTKKQDQLQDIVNLIENNPHFAVIKFEKTTHKSLEGLRRNLDTSNSKVKVVKNTLFEKAINRLSEKHQSMKEFRKKAFPIKENSAVLTLGNEWNEGLSAFDKYHEKEQTVSFKFGFLDDKLYLSNELERIAKLPGKTQLVAQVLSGMKSPLSKTTYALKYNLQKLAYILNAKSQKTA